MLLLDRIIFSKPSSKTCPIEELCIASTPGDFAAVVVQLSPNFQDMGKCASKQQKEEDESNHFNLAGGNVHVVSSQEEWEGKLSEARQENKTVLANFSASWCGPCKLMAPYYSELSETYPSLIFLIIDVDQMVNLSTSYDVKATPSIFFLKNGEQIDKIVGCNKPELLKKITSVIDSQPESPSLRLQPQ